MTLFLMFATLCGLLYVSLELLIWAANNVDMHDRARIVARRLRWWRA